MLARHVHGPAPLRRRLLLTFIVQVSPRIPHLGHLINDPLKASLRAQRSSLHVIGTRTALILSAAPRFRLMMTLSCVQPRRQRLEHKLARTNETC